MTAHVETMPDAGRKERVLASLKSIVQDLTGVNPAGMDIHANFYDVGVDSLMLIQATQAIQDRFAVKLPVVQLLEELNTLDAVATYLEQALPPDEAGSIVPPAPEPPAPAAATPAAPPAAAPAPPPAYTAPAVATAPPAAAPHTPPPAPASVAGGPVAYVPPPVADTAEQSDLAVSALEQLLARQLQLMGQQLELLRGAPAPHAPAQVHVAAPAQTAAANATRDASPAPPVAVQTLPGQQPPPAPQSPPRAPTVWSVPAPQPNTRGIEPDLFIPYQPIDKSPSGGLTPRQQQYLDQLTRSYTARTRESKRLTQEYRPYVADSRVSAGFRQLWKEMVYQLYAARSEGARMWDVDGNEYVDVTMGFGLHLFGHSPDFLVEAINRQLKEGTHLGPQIAVTGEVAKLICELTGMERVNFCNSGTEAVMGALRIARTVTRRNKIALFAGAYHGWADPTVARVLNRNGTRTTVPMAPGVPPLSVEETLVLDWNDPHSLDILRANAGDLACILVEPVQSRRPDIQPREYLHELRRIATEAGAVFIVDEMVTGFRVLPGGAQAWFGVEADLTIYGKVLGGGLPLGIVAGKAEFMDAFDGGMWQYGDASYPRAEKTLFAGAYFKHPLTMAVAHAALTRLRDEGERLLPEMNARTTRLAETLDRHFAEHHVPARVVNYGSLFRILFSREYKFTDIFYYQLVHNGVFIWEGRNCFLSAAHTDSDVDFVIEAVKKTVEQVRAGGFLPELPPDTPGDGGGGDSARATETPAPAAQAAGVSASSAAVAQAAVVNERAPLSAGGGAARPSAGLGFSLYYFGNYPTPYDEGKYDLLFKGVRFADEHGFEAVWLPERHFNSYGGFSPNPSILAAALARETGRIGLRAGSVVLPLHDPLRVAEDWAVIDNVSRGRVAISFASGWHPNDFAFAPDSYERRRDVMDEGIEVVRHLWRGGTIERRSGRGETIQVGLSALPMQLELPMWVTGSSHGTGEKAGRLGAGFLSNLQDQSIDELAAKIATYRETLARHGHDPSVARATVLLHTYVAEDLGKALADTHDPFREYMRSAMGLRVARSRNQGPRVDLTKISEADVEYFLTAGFERYKQVGMLIGTPDTCAAVVDRLAAAGVTEIGCLIDFGVPVPRVMESLHHLNTLRQRYLPRAGAEGSVPAEPARETLSLAADGGYSVPLTDMQKQFWVLTQLGPHVSRQYNESVTMRLRGALNVEAMRAAVRQLVARHDALRSSFSPEGERQIVHPAVELEVPLFDFAHIRDEAAREESASAWAREYGREPFDLGRTPLVRAGFARLEDRLHLFVFTTHHIVADGQAWNVMLTDLRELYAANCAGQPAQLPAPAPLGEQVSRRAELTGEEEAKSEAYWVAQFKDGFPHAELPTDRPRPAVPSYERAQVYSMIEAALADELKALSRRGRSTLFVTLLSGYSLLLHQLTGRDDLVVGINVADPLSVKRRDAVGYRLNPQMLRSKLAADQTVAEYVASVRKRVYESYEHQRYSFARVLHALNLRHDPRRAPLVAAGLNLDREDPPSNLHDLEVEFILDATTAPSLDIYLDIAETAAELRLKCNYNTDVFKRETVARWMRHLGELLAAFAADPSRRVSELPQFRDAAPVTTAEDEPPAATPEPARVGGEVAAEGAGGAAGESEGLTTFQRLLWVGQRLNPEEVAFVNLGLLRIKRKLDPAHLRAAFRAVVDRSDALRTVIEERDGEPRQRVLAEMPYEMDFLDLSGEPDPHARLEEWARARRSVQLDISRRPFDSALVKLGEEEFAWHLNVHHAVTDAQGFFLVYERGLEYYAHSVNGTLAGQPALPTFRDYLAYEAGLKGSRTYLAAEAYWKQKLSEPVEQPHFYGRPLLKPTTRVTRVARGLGRERTRRLKEAAARPELFIASEDATLTLVFAALTAAFVSRVSGSRRLALGVPFHNRSKPAFRETIGLFMQILPLHVSVEAGETFASLIRKLRAEFFTALRHHQYSVGNPVNAPAYDVECNYINGGIQPPAGLPIEIEWPHPGHAHESLAVQVHDITRAGELTVTFDFHEDVFGAARREEAVEQFFRLLDALIEDHTRPVRSVELLSEGAARRVLREFNRTEADFPLEQTFAALFESQAARTPERAAATDDRQTLTYARLNARANVLARRLCALGVGRGAVVPLLAPRGVGLLASILAVFKAGAAYLPLDPLYPPQRLLQFVEQSGASVLLMSGAVSDELAAPLAGLAAGGRLRVLALEELEAGAADAGEEENLPPQAGPGDLAYVIYTSGSTGRPKGAMLEQRGMVNHLFAKVSDLGLTERDAVAQNASQSFDISVWQFLAALLVGGRVSIVGDEPARDPRQLLALLEADSITVFETVPSMLRALLDVRESDERMRPSLEALRWMIATGEALPPDLCRRWLQAYPRVPLLNAYGPTECSDDVTHEVIAAPPAPAAHRVPIGRAVANTRLYVLDETLAPVPLGVPGELCVGGAGVGRGYLGDPARTAAVFVPDPFSMAAGARLYRTGDLARFMSDGRVEFLGRIDNQVKIRGHRIELGEIESVLREQPGVAQVVVTARAEEGGDRRLVAYVVAGAGEALDFGELRAALKRGLPDYMTPSAFVALDALPLNANGKLDLNALPAPDPAQARAEAEFVAPRGEAEETLAEIFRQVLRVERVGAHDNYFELGGDSILSIQISSRAAQAGLHVTPVMLFEHQTIAALAPAARESAPVRAEQGAVTGEVLLTPVQHWFFERELPNPHHYNQALILETRRPLDAGLLGRAVRHLAAHHDMLRARFEPKGDGWRQHLKEGDAGARFSHHDLSDLPAAERRAALEAEAARLQASLHLSAGPVARFAYFDFGPEAPGRLLLVAHHLVTDGVSWRVIVEDLQTAYEQLSRGAQVQLPPKTTSFKEWAERLSDYARSDESRRGAEYWLAVAGDRARPLPVDFAGGDNLIESAAGVSVTLSPEETEALLQRAPVALDAQVNEVLLTALARTLARWSGDRAVRVNLESHGREESLFDDVDLTRTVGWFTTFAPVLLDLGQAEGAEAELARVREQLRAVPGRGAGYGVLRYLGEDTSVRERLRAAEADAVTFNYLGRVDGATPESGLFKFAAESAGPNMSRGGRRTSLLDVNALVVGGRLRCDWSFSQNLHRRETIERLAREFADALREFAGGPGAAAADVTAGLADFNWGSAEAAEVAAALDNLES